MSTKSARTAVSFSNHEKNYSPNHRHGKGKSHVFTKRRHSRTNRRAVKLELKGE